MSADDFWFIRNSTTRPAARGTGSGGRVEILIYGDIGEDPLAPESWSAQRLVAALDDQVHDDDEIVVRMNSYGGSVADGLAMYNRLRRHPGKVTVFVEGVAVSIASLVAMAGDRIVMAENSLMMIHSPWALAAGNATDLRVAADTLDLYAQAMAASYARASGRDHAAVLALLTDGDDHWYTAAEAVEAGFAHEVTEALEVAASARIPDRFRTFNRRHDMAKRTPERPVAGRRLAGLLGDAIDAIDASEEDERSRADVIGQMASEAGIETSTVNEILSADIDCPPLERLAGFARVSGLPAQGDQRAAAETDGCEYAENGQARACNWNKIGEPSMTDKVEPMNAAQLRERNDQIRTSCRAAARLRPGLEKMEAELLADPSITAEQASARLMDALGEGCEPVTPHNYAPRMHSGAHSAEGEFRSAAADAILMRHGVHVANPHPRARDFLHASGVDLAQAALSRSGRRPRSDSPSDVVAAAMTTSDLPAIFEDTARKAAMLGFEENEAASHRRWVREGQVEDFRTHRRVALSEAPGLERVNEGAEYKQGSISDAAESIRVDTYGRIVGLSRQAIVNDDLGELARMPNALGQAAARKEADLVYSLLVDSPDMRDGTPLFHADHGNVATSADLNVASLGNARRLMRLQRGLAGEATLNLAPRFLLVPAALETAAEQLVTAIQPNRAADVTPDWVRQLEVVVDSRLDEASDSTWYLAAAPNQADTIEIARLGGAGAEVFTDESFDTDSVRFKIRLEVGAAALDWRGLVRVSA